MQTEITQTLKIHKLTEAQYNTQLSQGTVDANALYLTPYEEPDLSAYATKEDLNTSLQSVFNMIYPVGSIYMSIVSTNPSTLFGGTWEQIEDTFLMCAGATYTAGSVGGEAEHTLTIDEIPSHNHKIKTDINNSEYNVTWEPWTEWTTGYRQVANETISAPNGTTYSGGGQAHNNLPPYLAVYTWRRVG